MATVDHCLYCFEALSARLEKRTPLSLYQVQTLWAEYPKGLEDTEMSDSEDEDDAGDSSTIILANNAKRSPALERLAAARTASTSSPSSVASSSVSSSSLAPPSESSTTATTPNSSTTSFVPPGIARKTSQRAPNITESPLFVTWNKTSSRGVSLRGCIGTFSALPLSTALSEYALTSAFEDHRFSPISARELPLLSCDVTLLTDFEDCSDPMDWELGVHGIKISFYHHHRRHGATYLPDVAVEQGWTKEETIISLMKKGGWSGKRDKWREVADMKVVRYQGKKESADYEEFERFKTWVNNKK